MRASQIRVSLFLQVYRIEYRTIRSPLQGCLRPATELPHALRGAALDRSVGAAFFLVTELPHALWKCVGWLRWGLLSFGD